MSTKKVSEFIDSALSLYGYTASPVKKRELKFKLALADIKDTVSDDDYTLALDLILSEMDPKVGSVKTASTVTAFRSGCPRCSANMCEVKLGNTSDALYCAACHVTIPVR